MIKRIFFSFFILVFLLGGVSALVDIRIDVDPGFDVGDTVGFDYTFVSNSDETITYTPRISCVDHSDRLLSMETVDLSSGVPLTKTYEDFEVTGEELSQQCIAIIEIHSPLTQIKQEVFEIAGEKSLSFSFFVCDGPSCSRRSRTFLQDSMVYLDYTSSVESPIISTTLTSPDGSTKSINIPEELKAEQIGTYTLDIIVSKEGYRPVTRKEQFGVIERSADVETVPEGDEREGALIGGKLDTSSKKYLFYVIGAIFLILVIGVIFYLARKKKNPESTSPQV